jgi:uncharacterized protein YceK
MDSSAGLANMKTAVLALLVVVAVSGCATTLTSYKPADTQGVTNNQGVGSITSESSDTSLTVYPTFRYQSDSELPTFTLMVKDNGSQSLDFDPENVRAFLDDRQCHIYTLEERIGEIRRQKRRKQIALAIAGGLAAGASAYAASHSTTTYTGYGYVGRRAFYTTGTIQT